MVTAERCHECGGNVESEVNGNFEDWRCQDCGIIVGGGRLVETEQVWSDTPEDEPEYVGVYDDPLGDVCGHWVEGDDGMERCGEPATHTTVMRTHQTVELASCDEHGTPEHAGKSLYHRSVDTATQRDGGDR